MGDLYCVYFKYIKYNFIKRKKIDIYVYIILIMMLFLVYVFFFLLCEYKKLVFIEYDFLVMLLFFKI